MTRASGGDAPAARAVSRAALLFAGATAVAGCGSSTPGPGVMYGPGPVVEAGPYDASYPDGNLPVPEAGDDAGGAVAMYGPGPVLDATAPHHDGGEQGDAAEDTGGPVVLYGPAPVGGG